MATVQPANDPLVSAMAPAFTPRSDALPAQGYSAPISRRVPKRGSGKKGHPFIQVKRSKVAVSPRVYVSEQGGSHADRRRTRSVTIAAKRTRPVTKAARATDARDAA